MKVIRGYQTELDPTQKQAALLRQCAGAARFTYNYGLARKQEARVKGEKVPTAIDLQKELTARKQTDLSWLQPLSKWVVQNSLRDLDDAFKRFFKKCQLKKQRQHKGKCGFPRFKSKHKGRGSFRLDSPIHISADRIQLPKLGAIKLKEKEYIPIWGVKVLSATISEQAGHWFISVQVQEEHTESAASIGPIIGIDLGIKSLAVLSTGEVIENPKALRKNLKKLKRLSRQHSRKVKGSKNRQKCARQLARFHRHIANIRKDTLHKATTHIVAKTKPESERPSCIVIEDLHISGMLKNRKLARAIADVGLHEFRRQLMYKTKQAGVMLKVVSRWYPSSKTCSSCGTVRDELALSERVFVCLDCGYVADRDYNASKNLAAWSA